MLRQLKKRNRPQDTRRARGATPSSVTFVQKLQWGDRVQSHRPGQEPAHRLTAATRERTLAHEHRSGTHALRPPRRRGARSRGCRLPRQLRKCGRCRPTWQSGESFCGEPGGRAFCAGHREIRRAPAAFPGVLAGPCREVPDGTLPYAGRRRCPARRDPAARLPGVGHVAPGRSAHARRRVRDRCGARGRLERPGRVGASPGGLFRAGRVGVS